MTIRDWIIKQLRDQFKSGINSGVKVNQIDTNGIKVERPGRPDAVAFCVEQDSGRSFSVHDLEEALRELPQAGMVIITRRSIAPGVHSRSDELGVSIDTFGGFARALGQFDDISQYVHPEETYVRKRLRSTGVVTSIERIGHRAWLLSRTQGLRQLIIVTVDKYELTDDEFSKALDEYPDLTLDALVVTNPSAQGFGDRVINSSKQVGIPIFKIDDFLYKMREPWT
ncbi:hypothetical protein [Mycolicibacterium sp. P9-22]|uniref:hypothetical protein n=1 Tax=Mycolicibacterium sp. P9-22 TaxID=2024613 RepID=UPI0011ED5B7B|nr:hypothetical protein [Mycolicibacterium sp. P9-22]